MNFRDIIMNIYQLHMFYNLKQVDKLKKSFIPKDITNVPLPPDSKVIFDTDIDIEYISKAIQPKYREIIKGFSEVLKRNFNPNDLNNFYHNINALHINTFTENLKIGFYERFDTGDYLNESNTISLHFLAYIYNTLYHELFHLASAKTTDNFLYYCGFEFVNIKTKQRIGNGLNEGYTQLLASRYLPLNDKSNFLTIALKKLRREIMIKFMDEKSFEKNFSSPLQSYNYHLYIAEKLEQIVGKEKMQSLYLNANLKGLIDELKQYTNESEINKFINNLDFLLTCYYSEIQRYPDNILKEIDSFLIKCYSEKLKIAELDSNKSVEDNLTLTQYISELRMNRHKYKILPIGKTHENFGQFKNDDLKNER